MLVDSNGNFITKGDSWQDMQEHRKVRRILMWERTAKVLQKYQTDNADGGFDYIDYEYLIGFTKEKITLERGTRYNI